MYWDGLSNFQLFESNHLSLDDISYDTYEWMNLVGTISRRQSDAVSKAKAQRESQLNKSKRGR